jgi:hypothetical protein
MYKQYKRKGLSEMTPWIEGFDMTNVSVSEADKLNGSPKQGDMIARNPKNHEDRWLVAEKYFNDNLELAEEVKTEKTLTNTTASQAKNNVKDIVFWGDGDTFKLISKASSVNEGWMKSTKAMEIENVGCVVQVTTQQGNNVSEALTFVPGVKLSEFTTAEQVGTVTSRKLVKF